MIFHHIRSAIGIVVVVRYISVSIVSTVDTNHSVSVKGIVGVRIVFFLSELIVQIRLACSQPFGVIALYVFSAIVPGQRSSLPTKLFPAVIRGVSYLIIDYCGAAEADQSVTVCGARLSSTSNSTPFPAAPAIIGVLMLACRRGECK